MWRNLAPTLLAAAASFCLLGHAQYLIRPPSFTTWLVALPLLTLALHRPVAWYCRVTHPHWLAGGLGLLVAAWWGELFADDLWKLPVSVRPAAGVILTLAHAAFAAADGALALTRIACPMQADARARQVARRTPGVGRLGRVDPADARECRHSRGAGRPPVVARGAAPGGARLRRRTAPPQ